MSIKNKIVTNSIDFSHLLGRWINTYDTTKTIISFTLLEKDNQLVLEAIGADNGILPGTWGETVSTPLAYNPEKKKAVALFANYSFDFMGVHLSINTNKGILIIAGSCIFKDGSKRSDFYFREFYFLSNEKR